MAALAALAAPASRTIWRHLPEEAIYRTVFIRCPFALAEDAPVYAGPPGYEDVGWLMEINWQVVSAESYGWPTLTMALGLSATLALRGRRGTLAGWLTAALFVVVAIVFTIPDAFEIVSDNCVYTLRFVGWDLVERGPFLHYLAGAVLVLFLTQVRREGAHLNALLEGA
ncbi:hypothetical protein SAMN05421874_101136 [Nonomuraea maritima]|uniref:Uncharacterized protein n=1 Tax=Nonomuraea maritima TaxID=683260 RepID=A0A1G8S191_9ACTN|nr:hypothetical protein [Nonomuraea maritima]SDJ22973.1 hypothetical protein SAMN05421874_101136 [Nonomuraea maritima]